MTHGRTRGKAATNQTHTPIPPAQPAGAVQKPSAIGRDWPFQHNPGLAARTELMATVKAAASAAAGARLTDALGRESVALEVIAELGGDPGTRTAACESFEAVLHRLAGAPALTVADVAPKLAALVLDLVRSSSSGDLSPSAYPLMLASCALADLTMLRMAPEIPLPPKALDPIESPESIDYWRRLAMERGE